MKSKVLPLTGMLVSALGAGAQTKIKDGTIASSSTPHPSAILELESNSRALLLLRLSQEERDAIVDPVEGMVVFNTTDSCINQFSRGQWNSLCSSTEFCSVVLVGDEDDENIVTDPQ